MVGGGGDVKANKQTTASRVRKSEPLISSLKSVALIWIAIIEQPFLDYLIRNPVKVANAS